MGALMAEWLQRNRRLIGVVAGLSAALFLLVRLRVALTPFLVGVVLAYLLNPLVRGLCRRGFQRPVALAVVYVALLLLIGLGIGLLVPRIVLELARLAEFLPGYFALIQDWVNDFQEQYSQIQIPLSIRQAVEEAFIALQARLVSIVSAAAARVLGIFSAVVGLIAAFVVSYYVVRDAPSIRLGISRLIRAGERQRTMAILSDIEKVIAGFIRGQLTVALIVGTLTTVALLILGVRFAVVLGIIAGLAEIIPYFGPIIGAVPALAVTVVVSPVLALKVLLAFVIIQQIEAHLVSPRVMGKSVGIHPVMVIFALLVGYQLLGILGMIVAVPIAGIIRILVDLWLAERDEGLHPETAPAAAECEVPVAGQAAGRQVE